MRTRHNILTGIDFTVASRAALLEALRWAALDGAEVTALHVIEQHRASQLQQELGTDCEGVLRHVSEHLRSFLSAFGESAKDVRAEVEIGHPFLNITSACKRYPADLLVLGSHGEKHKANQVGVVAAKCVRKSPVDVLLVKENHVGPFQQVLACTDFSEASARAVRFGGYVAEHDTAKLDVLFINRTNLALARDYGWLPAGAEQSSAADEMAKSQQALEEFVNPLLDTYKVPSTQFIVREEYQIRDAVVQYISESNPGLVVLGTRGKSDLRALIMGTTAERIVQAASCSILAVKPENMLNWETC